jgi:hypothetical protein
MPLFRVELTRVTKHRQSVVVEAPSAEEADRIGAQGGETLADELFGEPETVATAVVAVAPLAEGEETKASDIVFRMVDGKLVVDDKLGEYTERARQIASDLVNGVKPDFAKFGGEAKDLAKAVAQGGGEAIRTGLLNLLAPKRKGKE